MIHDKRQHTKMRDMMKDVNPVLITWGCNPNDYESNIYEEKRHNQRKA